MNRRKWLITVFTLGNLVLILGLTGCGYHLLHSDALWPENVQKLYVDPLLNRTREPDLELTVTEAIIQELWRWNQIKVVPRSEAEGILSGQVSEYVADKALSFGRDRTIREYELTFHLKLWLKDISTEKIIWQVDKVVAREWYQYVEGDLAQTRAQEELARKKAAQEAARQMFEAVFIRGEER